jgi:hypothetical protein
MERGEPLLDAKDGPMTKKKTTRTGARESSKAEAPRHDRRTTGERRADDRRAHARFSPGDDRTDRRQGERRRA